MLTLRTLRFVLAFALALGIRSASAHQVPFSYVDLRLNHGQADVVVVAHIIDLAHDLTIASPESLLTPDILATHVAAIQSLVSARVSWLDGRGHPLGTPQWTGIEPLPERQSIRLTGRLPNAVDAPAVMLDARMFPYDPAHQTFVNVYADGAIAQQAILDAHRTEVTYFANTRAGAWAVVRRFIPTGIGHILSGPDHILFLVGLLLLGGGVRRLALIVSGFTLAHSVTLSCAALGWLTPSPRLIEPAIALSIIYVGADNLLVREGRDMRAWISFGFGFIHGFGFATVLRVMDLPRAALAWSLFSFNLGVEIGQLAIVGMVASLVAWLWRSHPIAGRRLVVAGSWFVIVAGAAWFVQRVFMTGGTT